ncbi:MAG TPA: sugar nucleotide-binding protein [Candidatus Acidoferrales bacterium]|nr:sugar nucleotide-binding protein [Candidatus Acidoferrales bacterium]
MKSVLLLGATGMLGSAVYGVLKDKYRLILGVRDAAKIHLLESAYGGTGTHPVVPFDAAAIYRDYQTKQGAESEYLRRLRRTADEVDYAINAIGVTIPFALHDPGLTFFVNGALPHVLARIFGEKLIHITTDCVYDGKSRIPYAENSPKLPTDVYGLSKSLGEPTECLTIRTSIVGRELDGRTGLLEWFLQQEGKEITGYAEHYWNGITTQQFGELCHQIMDSPARFPRRGLFHVFSTVVSKYEMLVAFQRKYGVRCVIREDHTSALNRTLTTAKELNSLLSIPPFHQMVEALPIWSI